MVCPEDDEFCITLENKYVEFEEGPDGNATSDIAWNMTASKVETLMFITFLHLLTLPFCLTKL